MVFPLRKKPVLWMEASDDVDPQQPQGPGLPQQPHAASCSPSLPFFLSPFFASFFVAVCCKWALSEVAPSRPRALGGAGLALGAATLVPSEAAPSRPCAMGGAGLALGAALLGPCTRSSWSGFKLLVSFLRTSDAPFTSAVTPFQISDALVFTRGLPPVPRSISKRLVALGASAPQPCQATASSTAAANSPAAPVRSSLPRPFEGLLKTHRVGAWLAHGARRMDHERMGCAGSTQAHQPASRRPVPMPNAPSAHALHEVLRKGTTLETKVAWKNKTWECGQTS